MNNTRFMKHSVLFVLFIAIFSLAFFTGCEKETEKIVTETVRDTIAVHDTIPIGIITVDSIYASPDMIAQGATVNFTAEVSLLPLAGSGLTYYWFATGGSFDNSEGDTVAWKAPDDPGAYTVMVHVSDGSHIGMGRRNVGVEMYAPTVDPHFVGDPASGCVCHEALDQLVTKWSGTAHAHAWQSLQESGHPASYCNPCHSIGYEPSPNTGNSGYDEAPIEKFVNVQCENCHGPASEHINSTAAVDMIVNYDMENCGKCHDGTHHPYKTEWLESPHNFDVATASHGAGARIPPICSGCHEGVGAAIRLSGDLSSFYRSGNPGRPDTTVHAFQPIVCQTCHSSHSGENPGQVRTVAAVPLVTANGESPVIGQGGVGKLCMHCHHARNSGDDHIPDGDEHFGPHSSPQADMVAAKSAYHGVAPAGFNWAGPTHLLVQNSCKTCHLPTAEFVSNQEPAKTGHRFIPTVEACEPCHGVIASFADIPAQDDFDGDGNFEGLQDEVEGMAHLLLEALVANGLDTVGADLETALGDTNRSTLLQREAGWNLLFVELDGSWGVHNARYAVQLLQQSYIHLTGNPPANAAVLKGNEAVVRNW